MSFEDELTRPIWDIGAGSMNLPFYEKNYNERNQVSALAWGTRATKPWSDFAAKTGTTAAAGAGAMALAGYGKLTADHSAILTAVKAGRPSIGTVMMTGTTKGFSKFAPSILDCYGLFDSLGVVFEDGKPNLMENLAEVIALGDSLKFMGVLDACNKVEKAVLGVLHYGEIPLVSIITAGDQPQKRKVLDYYMHCITTIRDMYLIIGDYLRSVDIGKLTVEKEDAVGYDDKGSVEHYQRWMAKLLQEATTQMNTMVERGEQALQAVGHYFDAYYPWAAYINEVKVLHLTATFKMYLARKWDVVESGVSLTLTGRAALAENDMTPEFKDELLTTINEVTDEEEGGNNNDVFDPDKDKKKKDKKKKDKKHKKEPQGPKANTSAETATDKKDPGDTKSSKEPETDTDTDDTTDDDDDDDMKPDVGLELLGEVDLEEVGRAMGVDVSEFDGDREYIDVGIFQPAAIKWLNWLLEWFYTQGRRDGRVYKMLSVMAKSLKRLVSDIFISGQKIKAIVKQSLKESKQLEEEKTAYEAQVILLLSATDDVSTMLEGTRDKIKVITYLLKTNKEAIQPELAAIAVCNNLLGTVMTCFQAYTQAGMTVSRYLQKPDKFTPYKADLLRRVPASKRELAEVSTHEWVVHLFGVRQILSLSVSRLVTTADCLERGMLPRAALKKSVQELIIITGKESKKVLTSFEIGEKTLVMPVEEKFLPDELMLYMHPYDTIRAAMESNDWKDDAVIQHTFGGLSTNHLYGAKNKPPSREALLMAYSLMGYIATEAPGPSTAWALSVANSLTPSSLDGSEGVPPIQIQKEEIIEYLDTIQTLAILLMLKMDQPIQLNAIGQMTGATKSIVNRFIDNMKNTTLGRFKVDLQFWSAITQQFRVSNTKKERLILTTSERYENSTDGYLSSVSARISGTERAILTLLKKLANNKLMMARLAVYKPDEAEKLYDVISNAKLNPKGAAKLIHLDHCTMDEIPHAIGLAFALGAQHGSMRFLKMPTRISDALGGKREMLNQMVKYYTGSGSDREMVEAFSAEIDVGNFREYEDLPNREAGIEQLEDIQAHTKKANPEVVNAELLELREILKQEVAAKKEREMKMMIEQQQAMVATQMAESPQMG